MGDGRHLGKETWNKPERFLNLDRSFLDYVTAHSKVASNLLTTYMLFRFHDPDDCNLNLIAFIVMIDTCNRRTQFAIRKRHAISDNVEICQSVRYHLLYVKISNYYPFLSRVYVSDASVRRFSFLRCRNLIFTITHKVHVFTHMLRLPLLQIRL
jgi:hypothetical protein